MADLALTAASICDTIELSAGKSSAGYALQFLNAGYRSFLLGQDPRTGRSHHWSFTRPLAQLSFGGSANSGASHSGVYVFATASIFNRSMVGLTMTVVNYNGSDDLTVNVTKYSSATCVTVDSSASWSVGNKTVSVESNGLANLPTNFGGLLAGPCYTYSETVSEATPELHEVGPETILADWRDSDDTDDPTMFAILPKTLTASAGQRYEMAFAPRPEESRTVFYRYLVNPDVLTDTATYPLGGAAHAETIKYAGLAAAEQEAGRVDNGPMQRRFKELMAASIDTDVDLFMTHDVESISNPGL
jgi:hypothetical protein